MGSLRLYRKKKVRLAFRCSHIKTFKTHFLSTIKSQNTRFLFNTGIWHFFDLWYCSRNAKPNRVVGMLVDQINKYKRGWCSGKEHRGLLPSQIFTISKSWEYTEKYKHRRSSVSTIPVPASRSRDYVDQEQAPSLIHMTC